MNCTPICTPLGVLRKGSWTEDEDFLLIKCIQKYGEGKWHLVPARSGLNRCRKSCRLRWLNYLRPHIKRGDFSTDEVDLILRLHKLLGNRWSLIAGRLPGRTANDVKNYWNTNLQRKSNIASHHHHEQQKINNKCIAITQNEIIRPQPQNFSSTKKNVSYLCTNNNVTNILDKDEHCNEIIRTSTSEKQTTEASTDNGVQWWTSFLENCNEIEEGEGVDDDKTPTKLLHDEKSPPLNGGADCTLKGQSNGWDDFSLDIDIWNLLN